MNTNVGKRKRTMEYSDMIQMYQDGYSTTDIGMLANVSARYVSSVLTKNNIQKRPHGSWKRQYQLNEDYFKKWTNNMAYILGFFVADGNIPRDAQTISISQKEKYILENIKREIESNHPIYKNKKTGVHLLNLNSKIMKNDLMQLHGIMPNKSTSIEFPYVPEEYMSHFIRGYFDGDGYINYDKFNVTFVGGSIKFMVSLIRVLENLGLVVNFNTNSKHHRVHINGRKSIKTFSDWIYHNKDIYLIRKFDKFNMETLDINLLKDRKLKNTSIAVIKRKQNFLRHYEQYNSLQMACDYVQIKIPAFQTWLKTDSEFHDQFIIIQDQIKE
ncbi:LAGLIDADG family homing endonuclease [Aquibacillus saliphilus]|uniref:LAGLIDADG family homing endonuclease n=1 Tax=Aquibacillus saliphilus TaxID=1909422 RepID=UPI001CF034B2|nr:LAGLIDADG family homing endonuclease [Aquibacillus saliphilus]